jgi:hypothetical protein
MRIEYVCLYQQEERERERQRERKRREQRGYSNVSFEDIDRDFRIDLYKMGRTGKEPALVLIGYRSPLKQMERPPGYNRRVTGGPLSTEDLARG